MSNLGPVRVALIQSGRFSYADVDLYQSIQLVGANNVGKTSLVAAFQFLFIDDIEDMYFSKSKEETCKYYFEHDFSWILFECNTARGTWVVGARGLGALQQYHFKRFAYRGRINREDFVDDNNHVRPATAALARLQDREFVSLEPAQLRAALIGSNEAGTADLRLIPLRQRADYPHFSEIFCNLHRLGRIGQKELKRLFVNVYQLRGKTLDLVRHFRGPYQSVQQQKESVERLNSCLVDAKHAIDADDRLRLLQGSLPRLWLMILRGYKLAQDDFKGRLLGYDGKLTILDKEAEDLQIELEETRKQRDTALEKRGAIKAKIEELESAAKQFEDFDEQKIKKFIADIKPQLERLIYRILAGKEINPDQLAKEVVRLRGRLEELRRSYDHLPKLAATHLQAMLPLDEIQQIFTILNPQMLDMIVAENKDSRESNSVFIRDPSGLSVALRAISSRIVGYQYQDTNVDLDLTSVRPLDLNAYDLPRLREDITNAEADLNRQNTSLEDVARLEALDKERSTLADQLAEFEKLLADFERWRGRAASESLLRDQFSETAQQVEEHTRQEASISGKFEEFRGKREELSKSRGEVEKKSKELTTAFNELTQIDTSSLMEEEVKVPTGAALDKAIEQYRDGSDNIVKYQKEREAALEKVEKATYGEYMNGSKSPVEQLREAVDALPRQEFAVAEYWNQLIVSVKAALKDLIDAVNTLEVRVNEFSRRIGRISISDLASVQIQLTRTDIVQALQAILDAHDEPLFTQPSVTKSAMDRLKGLLEEHPRLELVQLFELGFCVVGSEKKQEEYQTLDKIQSNGTTITIKIIVNLILLSNLLTSSNVRIPFYIDEVDSLDDKNLEAILKLAEQLGFVPILASPKPRDNVDAVYFLYAVQGRVTLTPEFARVRMRSRQAETTNGLGEPDGVG